MLLQLLIGVGLMILGYVLMPQPPEQKQEISEMEGGIDLGDDGLLAAIGLQERPACLLRERGHRLLGFPGRHA